ncbi:MAG: hypothetical protein NUW37_17255 [Planctomycetes bacterium]|nr:hypothetical protein [Planctomycetota bacterium]
MLKAILAILGISGWIAFAGILAIGIMQGYTPEHLEFARKFSEASDVQKKLIQEVLSKPDLDPNTFKARTEEEQLQLQLENMTPEELRARALTLHRAIQADNERRERDRDNRQAWELREQVFERSLDDYRERVDGAIDELEELHQRYDARVQVDMEAMNSENLAKLVEMLKAAEKPEELIDLLADLSVPELMRVLAQLDALKSAEIVAGLPAERRRELGRAYVAMHDLDSKDAAANLGITEEEFARVKPLLEDLRRRQTQSTSGMADSGGTGIGATGENRQ